MLLVNIFTIIFRYHPNSERKLTLCRRVFILLWRLCSADMPWVYSSSAAVSNTELIAWNPCKCVGWSRFPLVACSLWYRLQPSLVGIFFHNQKPGLQLQKATESALPLRCRRLELKVIETSWLGWLWFHWHFQDYADASWSRCHNEFWKYQCTPII